MPDTALILKLHGKGYTAAEIANRLGLPEPRGVALVKAAL